MSRKSEILPPPPLFGVELEPQPGGTLSMRALGTDEPGQADDPAPETSEPHLFERTFRAAMRAYICHNHDQALLLFEQALQLRPDDIRCRTNIDRIRARLSNTHP